MTLKFAVLVRPRGILAASIAASGFLAPGIAGATALSPTAAPVAPSSASLRVASGSTRFRVARKSQITIKPTRRGRRVVRRSRSLSITAVATFTPDESDPVSATREFKLS